MLAIPMEEFVTNLVDWLPQKLEHPVEIVIYMAFLSILMLVPVFLWIGAAIAVTKRRQRRTPQPVTTG
jgi:hypothetical protein